MLNANVLSNAVTKGVWAWYAIRVDLLCTMVLAAGSLSTVWLRNSVDPVLLTLSLQYLLNLSKDCSWGLMWMGEFERKMVCVQRIFSLEDVP
jgi:ABC-type multidrug transport system fused ATPase/permease subunit